MEILLRILVSLLPPKIPHHICAWQRGQAKFSENCNDLSAVISAVVHAVHDHLPMRIGVGGSINGFVGANGF